jgi:hypothetical protein
MCGRPLAFRQLTIWILGFAQWLGRSPEFIVKLDGSAERFRTSGGIAGSRESLFRQSSPHHVLHNPDLSALATVDVGCEIEQFGVLS